MIAGGMTQLEPKSSREDEAAQLEPKPHSWASGYHQIGTQLEPKSRNLVVGTQLEPKSHVILLG